ncbi:MAG: 8-oxoguanine deaminase [Alphaproteobacteria bacterium]
MAIWIRNPLAILVDDGIDAGGGLVVDGTTITELVPAGHEPKSTVSRRLNADHHVVLPGLINTHHHYYQTLTRSFGPALNLELFPWLKTLYPVWAGLRPGDLRLAAKLAMCELLLSGCTTSVDHHYVFPKSLKNAIDIEIEVAKELGMRAVLTRGSMNLSEKNGGLPPDEVVQDDWTILTDSERLVKIYNRLGDRSGAMIEIALAPCSPFSVTTDLMRATAVMAEHLDCRLHTHLAETEDESRFCQDRFGMSPLDYLEEQGWLTARTWLAHGVHFDDDDIRRLAAAGTAIAHCPAANMVLGSGICRVQDLQTAGVAVGLAVDGSASNDSSNLMQEARLALLLQRVGRRSTTFTHEDALRLATAGSARCLGRDDIGRIAVGCQADLALFKLDEPRFSGHGDPLAALVLCGAHRADKVMVAGRWLVEDGRLTGVDLPTLMAAHQKAARRLQEAA